MDNKTIPSEFQELINDEFFPDELLESASVESLYAEFKAYPAQFTRNVLSVYARSRTAKWETPEGQALRKKLNLSKEDLIRWA